MQHPSHTQVQREEVTAVTSQKSIQTFLHILKPAATTSSYPSHPTGAPVRTSSTRGCNCSLQGSHVQVWQKSFFSGPWQLYSHICGYLEVEPLGGCEGGVPVVGLVPCSQGLPESLLPTPYPLLSLSTSFPSFNCGTCKKFDPLFSLLYFMFCAVISIQRLNKTEFWFKNWKEATWQKLKFLQGQNFFEIKI